MGLKLKPTLQRSHQNEHIPKIQCRRRANTLGPKRELINVELTKIMDC